MSTQNNNQLEKAPTKFDALRLFIAKDTVQDQLKNAVGDNADAFAASIIDLYTGDSYLQNCQPELVVMQSMKAAVLKLPVIKSLGFTYIVPSKKRSYNGVFTETVQFDEIFKEKKLYLTRIVCVIKNLIGTESETRVLGYRWLFTTDLYNNLYFGNIYDFYNFGKSELDEYNKVKLDVDISHTSYVS